MQDHPIICQSFEVADGVLSGDIMRNQDIVQAVVAQYQASREGPLGQSTISCAFVPSMFPPWFYRLLGGKNLIADT